MGGAHHDHVAAANNIKKQVIRQLTGLEAIDRKTLLEQRYQKFRNFGEYRERGRKV